MSQSSAEMAKAARRSRGRRGKLEGEIAKLEEQLSSLSSKGVTRSGRSGRQRPHADPPAPGRVPSVALGTSTPSDPPSVPSKAARPSAEPPTDASNSENNNQSTESNRHKRMFSTLVGTLQQFKREEQSSSRAHTEAKRAEQWAKAERKARNDSDTQLVNPSESLRKRREVIEIRLERCRSQMRLAELDELAHTLSVQAERRSNFACTRTEPPLFWRTRSDPLHETDEAFQEALEDTQKELKPIVKHAPEWIEHERDQLLGDITALDGELESAQKAEKNTKDALEREREERSKHQRHKRENEKLQDSDDEQADRSKNTDNDENSDGDTKHDRKRRRVEGDNAKADGGETSDKVEDEHYKEEEEVEQGER